LIPILMNGLGYAIFESAFWVSVPYVVPEKLVGTAYGVSTVFGNIAGVLAPLILAYLQSYDVSETGVQEFYF
jgi:MFS family permease